MGGVSEGKFNITDKKTMEVFGTLSRKNNGGFASVRTKAKKLSFKEQRELDGLRQERGGGQGRTAPRLAAGAASRTPS